MEGWFRSKEREKERKREETQLFCPSGGFMLFMFTEKIIEQNCGARLEFWHTTHAPRAKLRVIFFKS